MDNNEKQLLVISSGFPDQSGKYLAHTFVKGYVEEAKNEFEKVIVLVLLPFIPSFLRKFAGKFPRNLKNYSIENVSVIYSYYPFIPIWPFTRFRGKIAFLWLQSAILKYFNNNTIVHANFTDPAGVFAYNLFKRHKLDYLLTVHEDHDWLVKEIKSKNSLLIKAWSMAKNIIRVNELDNKILEKYNENVITIPNGFNHRKFKPLNTADCKNKLNIPKEKKVIVNIGFYNNKKNQKLLIEAINLLGKDIKRNVVCYIIGGGPRLKDLESTIASLNLEEQIFLVGQVDHDRLPIYLNTADIFCLSSNSEGNPTVMFEALGIGIPYVGTNVGGISEIIISDKYGLLCNPKDKNALSEIIEKGLYKNWNRDEIVKYSNQFSWKNIFLSTKQYY